MDDGLHRAVAILSWPGAGGGVQPVVDVGGKRNKPEPLWLTHPINHAPNVWDKWKAGSGSARAHFY